MLNSFRYTHSVKLIRRGREEDLQSLYWQFKMNSFHANNRSSMDTYGQKKENT